jgi:RNA polymerase sigma-70 factor (sigma-E family)
VPGREPDVLVAGGSAPPLAAGLEELYRRYAGGAMRMAFFLTGDRELAQDLVQDAFVRVAGRFHHLHRPDAFEAYLRRAVVNLCASHHRRVRVARGYEATQPRGADPVVDGPDVDTRELLRVALGGLPVRQRAAVVLRYYDDLPEQQVAQILGCSVPAVRSLVTRAMATLRDRVGGDEA